LQHLFVTQHFLPELGGAARRNVALVRRYPEPMAVSTVAANAAARHDASEDYRIDRQRFNRDSADSFFSRAVWQRWLTRRSRGRVHVLHAGDVLVAGRVVRNAHRRLGVPYIVYVSAGELRRVKERMESGSAGRRIVRPVLGDAAGIAATTSEVADMARDVIKELAISEAPPVAALGLGTDPGIFGPGRDTGTLRARWGIRHAPIMLTVARFAPHKGQDVGIQALSLLRHEFPELRYVLVGEGGDEARLRNLAADLNVMDRVGFAGPMRDDELPEAYATSTIYLDPARVASDASGDAHGMALIEAAAAALPIITSDTVGAGSIVRNGENGLRVDTSDPQAVADAIATLLRDAELCNDLGLEGRELVETSLNWTRVAHDTARFVRECVANG
jgi:glycosyltransferase involved in cell wall biosynthesis